LAARWTTGKRLAGADARVLEDFGKAQFMQIAICRDALALRFQAQAAVSLFFA